MHTLALYGKLRRYNANRACLLEVMVLIYSYWDSCFNNNCCYDDDDDDNDSNDNRAVYQALSFVLYMLCRCYYYNTHFTVEKTCFQERFSGLSRVTKAVCGRTRIHSQVASLQTPTLNHSAMQYCPLIPIHHGKLEWDPTVGLTWFAVANRLKGRLQSRLGKTLSSSSPGGWKHLTCFLSAHCVISHQAQPTRLKSDLGCLRVSMCHPHGPHQIDTQKQGSSGDIVTLVLHCTNQPWSVNIQHG